MSLEEIDGDIPTRQRREDVAEDAVSGVIRQFQRIMWRFHDVRAIPPLSLVAGRPPSDERGDLDCSGPSCDGSAARMKPLPRSSGSR